MSERLAELSGHHRTPNQTSLVFLFFPAVIHSSHFTESLFLWKNIPWV